MSNNAKSKERSFFGKLCAILTDILVYPVLIIAFICAIFMSSAKANNQVPSILGNSVVQVLTSSMDLGTEQSYKVGDVLIINQNINLKEIEVGDCIAFYAPKQRGYVDDNGNSLIIFHRVVRIIYVKESNEVNTRYFVCRGDAVGSLSVANGTLIPAQNPEESDYNAEGNIEPGGGYVVRLFDDDEPATNQDHAIATSQSQLQYVSDEFVVGELKSRANGFLSGLVKFCCSSIGITIMVIVPSMVMIGMVIINMVRESKNAKKSKEEESLVFAQNMGSVGGSEIASASDGNATADKGAEQKQDDVASASVQPKTPAKPESLKQAPAKKPEKEQKVANTKVAPAKATPKKENAKETSAKDNVASEPKAPAKATHASKTPVPTKATPTKAPAVPKPAPNKAPVAPAKAEPKTVPAKSAPSKATAPKAAPKSAPTKPVATKAPPTKAPPKKG